MKRQNVTLRAVLRRKRKQWLVDRFEDGRRRRTFYSTRAEAVAEAARLRDQIASAGSIWMSLGAAERDDLVRFGQACHERNLSRWDLLRSYDEGQLRAAIRSPALKDVIDEVFRAKETSGRAARYTHNFRNILMDFARGREGVPMNLISVADVEVWLGRKKLASRGTYRTRLATLFNFAVRRKYMAENLCRAIEMPKITRATPHILSPEQVQRCMGVLLERDRRGLAWFVLSTFCGLRPEEAQKTQWDAIEINGEAHIRVEAQTSKVRQRRIVTPLPEAVAWLRLAKELGSQLPISNAKRLSTLHRLKRELGLPVWLKDVTRHSAASYWLAIDGNPGHVAEQLGHTVSELKTSYRQLVTRETAAKFWAITPKKQ